MEIPGVPVDEGDVFQCGKCLEPFLSLPAFILHKQVHQSENQNGGDNEEFSEEDEKEKMVFDSNQNASFLAEIITVPSTSNEFVMDQGQLTEHGSTVQVTSPESLHFITPDLVHDLVPTNTIPTEVDKTNNVIKSNRNEADICETSSRNSNNSIRCNHCDKTFKKKFDLKEHMRSHTGERPYQCPICGRTFSQNSNVKKHIDTHKVWPNPWRSVSLTDPSLLEKGREAVDCIKSFKCLYCPSVFKSYFDLKLHRRIHSSLKVFKCMQGICQATFSDASDYMTHMRSCHGSTGFHCHVCQERFEQLCDLANHYADHHGTNNNSQVVISCDVCGASFKRMLTYERHIAEECGCHRCIKCGKAFAAEGQLRRHLESHIHSANHLCHCGKAFATPRRLDAHAAYAHRSSPVVYKCNVCSAIFRRKDNFFRHNIKHKTAKQLKCPYDKAGCMKSFSRTDSFKLHISRHLKVKPLCITCCKPLTAEYCHPYVLVKCACPQDLPQENGNDNIAESGNLTIRDEVDMSLEVPTIDVVVMPVPGADGDDDEATFNVVLPPEEPGQPNLMYTIQPFKS